MVPNWAQKWIPNGAFFGAEKLQTPLNSLCFRSKRPPEGGPFLAQKVGQNGAQNRAQNEPNFGPKSSQNGPKIHQNLSLLEIGQKGGLGNFQKIS